VAQFDLYKNSGENAFLFPYLLDITHELHTLSKLRVVVPLCNDGHAVTHLNPIYCQWREALYVHNGYRRYPRIDVAGQSRKFRGETYRNSRCFGFFGERVLADYKPVDQLTPSSRRLARSWSQSEIWIRLKVTRKIIRPGKKLTHQAISMTALPSLRMLPQLISGGVIPSPR